jgi:hypothetical protein
MMTPGATEGAGDERDDLIWADVHYHLDLGVRLAASGRAAEAAAEVALAQQLLVGLVGQATRPAWRDLPIRSVEPDGTREQVARTRARALAREIEAHYVSEGQHSLADAYHAAAARLTPETEVSAEG